MPAIQSQQLAMLAKQLFKAKGIVLPQNFTGFPPQAPFTAADQRVPDPNALFVAASTNKYHVDTQKTISKNVEELIDACADAVGKTFQQWQSSAKFVNVLINGPVGMAMPSSLIPPTFTGATCFANCNVAGKAPSFVQHAKAITMAIGTAFQAWQSGYMITLTFPGGALCSVTMPPSPNIPMPVAAGMSPGDALMSAQSLKGLMLANHGGPPGNHTVDIYDAFSQAFSMLFMQWKASSMITNIMGAGGVAPPPPAPPAPVVMALGNGGMIT